MFDPLPDGFRDFIGFPHPAPHTAIPISDYDEGAETEPPTSFHYFGNPVNVNYPVRQFQCARINLRQCPYLLREISGKSRNL
jgi:hypothetical protein